MLLDKILKPVARWIDKAKTNVGYGFREFVAVALLAVLAGVAFVAGIYGAFALILMIG